MALLVKKTQNNWHTHIWEQAKCHRLGTCDTAMSICNTSSKAGGTRGRGTITPHTPPKKCWNS